MESLRIAIDKLRTVAFGDIGLAYTGIGTPFEHLGRILYLQNLTDVQLMFSDDGVDDKLTLPANGYITVDLTANKNNKQGLYITKGERLFVKYVAALGSPSSGAVYLTIFYSETWDI